MFRNHEGLDTTNPTQRTPEKLSPEGQVSFDDSGVQLPPELLAEGLKISRNQQQGILPSSRDTESAGMETDDVFATKQPEPQDSIPPNAVPQDPIPPNAVLARSMAQPQISPLKQSRRQQKKPKQKPEIVNDTWLDNFNELELECQKAKEKLQSSSQTFSANEIFAELQEQIKFRKERNEHFVGLIVDENQKKYVQLVFEEIQGILNLGIYEYVENTKLKKILDCAFTKNAIALVEISRHGQSYWKNELENFKKLIQNCFNVELEIQNNESLLALSETKMESSAHPKGKIQPSESSKRMIAKKRRKLIANLSSITMEASESAVTPAVPLNFGLEAAVTQAVPLNFGLEAPVPAIVPGEGLIQTMAPPLQVPKTVIRAKKTGHSKTNKPKTNKPKIKKQQAFVALVSKSSREKSLEPMQEETSQVISTIASETLAQEQGGKSQQLLQSLYPQQETELAMPQDINNETQDSDPNAWNNSSDKAAMDETSDRKEEKITKKSPKPGRARKIASEVPANRGRDYYTPLTQSALKKLQNESANLPFRKRMEHVFFKHAKISNHIDKTIKINPQNLEEVEMLSFKTKIYTTYFEFDSSKGKIPVVIKIKPTKLFQQKRNGNLVQPVSVKVEAVDEQKAGNSDLIRVKIFPTKFFEEQKAEGFVEPSSWQYPEKEWKKHGDIKMYYDIRVYQGDNEILYDFCAELDLPKAKEWTQEDEEKLRQQIQADLQTKSLPQLIAECEADLAQELKMKDETLKEMGETVGELHSVNATKEISGTDAMEFYCSNLHGLFNRRFTGLVDDSKFTDANDTYRVILRLILVIINGETFYERQATGVSLESGKLATAFDGELDQDPVRRQAAIITLQNYSLANWLDGLLEQQNSNPFSTEDKALPALLIDIANRCFPDAKLDLRQGNPFAGKNLTVKQLVEKVYLASQERMKQTGERQPTTDLINLSKLLCDGIKVHKNELTKPIDKSKKIGVMRDCVYELLWRSYFWQMRNPTLKKRKAGSLKKPEDNNQASQSNKRQRTRR